MRARLGPWLISSWFSEWSSSWAWVWRSFADWSTYEREQRHPADRLDSGLPVPGVCHVPARAVLDGLLLDDRRHGRAAGPGLALPGRLHGLGLRGPHVLAGMGRASDLPGPACRSRGR